MAQFNEVSSVIGTRRDDETLPVSCIPPMKPFGSFISEHTAEYALVPDLVRRLSPRFRDVIPMFFWSTREGNATATSSMSGITVRLLTAFPRRPKVSELGQDRIIMKVNQQLLGYARASADAGITVLAGIPLVSSILTLRVTSQCSWFDLREFVVTNEDCFIEMALDGTVTSNAPSRVSLRQPLNDLEILDAASRCLAFRWEDAVEILRQIRCTQLKFRGFPFFGGYKPFHVILPCNEGV